MTCAPSKDSDQPGHPPSLPVWRHFGSLATHWALGKDSDQSGWMPRLIWVLLGAQVILLVLLSAIGMMERNMVVPKAKCLVGALYLFSARPRAAEYMIGISKEKSEETQIKETRRMSRSMINGKDQTHAPIASATSCHVEFSVLH